ncbi:vitamin D3 receptor B-like isoform X3 [Asterias amurensis]|uniref:vitamin D3 receptor B-like isoform X3 n=1 Tax=Asterias amurensis TaxID=7602 RepID=UPI003AB39436
MFEEDDRTSRRGITITQRVLTRMADGGNASNDEKTTTPPICAVCGDQANGMHYRALTCEGCKTFFRRNGRKRADLKCEMGSNGKCVMDLYMRRHCSGCRMKKCLEVGMRLDRLWDKERIKTRKPIVKKLKPKGAPGESSNAEVPGEPTCSSSVSGTQEEAPSASTAAVYSTCDTEKKSDKVPDIILDTVAAGKLPQNPPHQSTQGRSKEKPETKQEDKLIMDVAIIDIQQRPRERSFASNAKGRLVGKQGKHLVIEDVVSTEFIPSPNRATTSEVTKMNPPLDPEGLSQKSCEFQTQIDRRRGSSASSELKYQEVLPPREMLPLSGRAPSPLKNSMQKDFDASEKSDASVQRKRTVSDSCAPSSGVCDDQSTEYLTQQAASSASQMPHTLKKCHPKFYRSQSNLSRSPDCTGPSVSFGNIKTLPKDSSRSSSVNLALVSPVKNADRQTQSTCTSYVANDPSQSASRENLKDAGTSGTFGNSVSAAASAGLSEIAKSVGVDLAVFKHFMEVMILVLKNMTMFAKCLQGFSTLTWEDQASLVKGAYLEFLILTSAELFDLKSKSFVSELVPGQEYTQDVGSMGGFGEVFNSCVSFSEKMHKLELRQEETALLFAISIMTPDRPDVQDTTSISSEQQILVEALQTCLKHNHPDQTNLFPKTIMLLTDVRDLTEKYMEDIMNLKLQGKEILPLLCEMFNL